MQWIAIDDRTASMVVPGGTLYRYTTYEGSVAMCFAPFNPVPQHYNGPSQFPSWAPSVVPNYNPAYCSSNNGAVAPR